MTEPTPPPPPAAPPTAPAKKGLSPLAWIAIGCLVLLLLGSVAIFSCTAFFAKKASDFAGELSENPTKVIAELAVKANPDLEIVSSDDDEGTMTIRDSSTGETVTMNFEDIAEGRIVFETDEGEMRFDVSDEEGVLTVTTDEGEARFGASGELPSWIARYPAARDLQIGFTSQGPQGTSGSFGFSSADSPQKLLDWYREELAGGGFEVQVQTVPTGGLLSAERSDPERKLSLIVSSEEGGSSVTGTYSEGS